MDSPVTFGGWLFQKRKECGLTREELARRVGCSVSALRKIEGGERRPSVQIAELIANCLSIPPEARSTFVRVARGELRVDRLLSVSTPAPVVPTPRINLPVIPTPLIGRQRELEELRRLLGDPHCRLLTLVGPGGIGKTRLAIETATQAQAAFADGVHFVPLMPVNSSRLIVPVIADSIGCVFHSADRADPKTQLFSYLKEKQILLLVDNLEQLLIEPGIEVLAELLANAPQVKLLATSRESLGLQDEWVSEVQGLPVPEREYAEGSAQNTSVELFLQRARRAHVTFDATPEDYSAIVRICQLVEGSPLGIELAAAWVRTLSCGEIAREIEHGLDILSVSTRSLPARHHCMRCVVDHSWKLLTAPEQGALRWISAFRGGFRREAAESVAGATLTLLSSLVTKSLIRRNAAGRFDLHELIRQFAVEQLAERPAELAAAQARHGHYYLTFFGQADGRLRSSAQREALAELTVEIDNFRAAWDWAVTHGEFALIEPTMRAFFMLYDTLGWFQEGLDTLGQAVNAVETAHGHSPPDRTERVALGHILATRSWLAYRLANYVPAQRMLERSMDILRPLNEPRVLVEAIIYLGMVMETTGNYARALELYSEGLEMATAIGDRWFAALGRTSQIALVGITREMVDPEITHERMRSVVAEWRSIGDPRSIANGLNLLSRSALRLGRYDEARAALEEKVALDGSISFRSGLGRANRELGVVAQAQGKHQEALVLFRNSVSTFTELGGSWSVARVLTDMGRSFFALGNDSEARRVWREALRLATDIHGTPVALEALAGLASLQAKQGHLEHALELLLVVLDHLASFDETKNRAARLRADLEARLTPEQIEAAKASAQAQAFDQVVEKVLHSTAG